jgi:hypothetical protein
VAAVWYSYALVRVVPRVERGECINAGAILFARQARFLGAGVELDPARLLALAPDADVAAIARHLQSLADIAAGRPAGGPLAALPPSDRVHWLTAPRSTIIQPSPVHVGVAADPTAALESLLDAYVRPPRALAVPAGAADSAAARQSGEAGGEG